MRIITLNTFYNRVVSSKANLSKSLLSFPSLRRFTCLAYHQPQHNTYIDTLCLFPFLFKTIGGPQTVHVVYLVCALDFLSLYRMGCGINYRWAKPSSFLCYSQNAVHKIQLKHHHLHSAGQSLLSFHFFCTLHTMLPLHSPLRRYVFNIPISTDRQWAHWGQGWNLFPFSLLRAKYHRIHCGCALQLFNLLSTGRL